jgi:hypothetical protein
LIDFFDADRWSTLSIIVAAIFGGRHHRFASVDCVVKGVWV